MNQLVQNEDVFFADQRGEGPERGRVPGGKSERRLGALECGEGFLQLMERRQGSGDEPRRAGASAKLFHRPDGGLFEGGMIGEAEIIVGRKIEVRAAVDRDARRGRGIHPAQFPAQTLLPQGFQPAV